MKTKAIILFLLILASVLSNACGSTIRNVEVTRIVPQTVVVTQLATQIVQVPISTTHAPTDIPNLLPKSTPSPKWTPDFTDILPHILTLTPGLQVVDDKTRPDVEKFLSAQYIKGYLILDYGYRSFGGKVFCGYTPIGIGNDGQSIKLYLWTTCQEYYLKDQKLTLGSGVDRPVVLFLGVRNGQYKIVDIKDSGGGNQLVKINFPPDIQNIILDLDNSPKAFKTGIYSESQRVEQEAKTFFEK